MVHISPTGLESFDCRLKWHWGHQLNYRPIRQNNNLQLGIGIHKALEFYYAKRIDPIKTFTEWIDAEIAKISGDWMEDAQKMIQARTLGISMLEGYLQEYKGKEPFKVVATEKEMHRLLPIPGTTKLTDCQVTVRIDTIVRDTELNKLYVLEHKTFSRFSPDHLNRDHQIVAQAWVAESELPGKEISGVIYNGLRKQVAGPRVKVALFERHYVNINQSQKDIFLERAYWTYRQMIDPKLHIFPQPNTVRCSWCAFKEPCSAYCKGGDYEFILKTMFEGNDQPTVEGLEEPEE